MNPKFWGRKLQIRSKDSQSALSDEKDKKRSRTKPTFWARRSRTYPISNSWSLKQRLFFQNSGLTLIAYYEWIWCRRVNLPSHQQRLNCQFGDDQSSFDGTLTDWVARLALHEPQMTSFGQPPFRWRLPPIILQPGFNLIGMQAP